MAQIFLKTLLIMAVLFAFMLPGYALKKLKMLGDGATLTLSNILLYVCQPALAVKAFCVFSDKDWQTVRGLDRLDILADFGVVAAISVMSILLMYGLCRLIFLKPKNKKVADVYSFIAIFSNCGFLGVPFIEMFTDGNPVAVMYIMVFNVTFNFLCWTLGVVLVTGSLKNIRLKKLVCNPAIISSLVALILFFVPEINFFMLSGLEPLRIFPQYLSYMTAPLSMIIVGIRIVGETPKALFGRKGVYLAGGLRLIAAPLLTLALALPFYFILPSANAAAEGVREYVFLAPVIAMTMSPAASVVAMAESFDGDKQTATSSFITVTLLSIITIPLMIMATSALWQSFTLIV